MMRRGIGVLFCVYCLTGSVVGQNFVNVAINKTYNQSSTWNIEWLSKHAANNNTRGTVNDNNCIHTKEGPNHWWEVDLGRTYPVHDITVWARTGFIRSVFPSTITVDNQPCVSVTSIPTSRNKSVRCSSVMYGRVVRLTYTGTEPYLNLCEFQIFVCKDGFYGDDCSSSCDQNCKGGCHRTSGHCINCMGGFWGSSFCRQDCPANCAGDTCQRNDGHCVSCKSGFWGTETCDKDCHVGCAGACDRGNGHCAACTSGFWGTETCDKRCSAGCAGATCDRDNGHCACKANFLGDKCTACKQGFHGDDCSQACNTNCEGGCIKANGRCTACKGNFAGDKCTACKQGFHGDDCSQACNTNCEGGCIKANGRCTDCTAGYWGSETCDSRCSAGCADACDRVDGHCDACRDGLYGPLCDDSCSPGCARCDQQSGNCTTCTSNSNLVLPGCTECLDGYYKQTAPPCIQCPGTCDNNTPCDKTTGHCQQCAPGKKGDTCDEEKPANQNDSLVVPVVSSVVGAGVIIAIAVVGSVCWYRRSRGGPAAKPDTRSTVNEPEHALGDNGTERLGRQPPSSSSPQEDATYYEISDTVNTHEMQKMENNYDALHPYSNDDADRQPYSQIMPHSSDVTKTSANAAYVNTAFHNVRGTNNM